MEPTDPTIRPTHSPQHQRSFNHLLPPTPAQCTAISDLQSLHLSFKDPSILDSLKIARSARNEIQQRRGISSLTDKEFNAIVALSSADDENIREWFRKSNQSHDINNIPNLVDQRYSTNSADSRFRSSQASSRKFPRSSAYTTPRSSLQSCSSKHSSLPPIDSHPEEVKLVSGVDGSVSLQSYDRLEETPETAITTITSPPSEFVNKKFRCTTGEHLPKAFSSKYTAFRRHELEHVEKYHCIPRNFVAIYDTRHGKQCLLCGELNPHQGHLSGHHIEPCFERDEPLRFTRQDLLAKHLKEKHAVPTDRTKMFTKKWFYQVRKTAFSCGICVGVLFESKDNQLSHIQQKHKDEGMGLWSETTMMRSLLQHPQVSAAWQQILAQHPGVQERSLFWPRSVLDSVPLELDLNSETAESFAATAFRTAESSSEMVHQDDTRFPLRLAVEMKGETSGPLPPPLPPPRLLSPQDYVNSFMIDSSWPTEFDLWDIKDSACDPTMPPAQHIAPARVADRLGMAPNELLGELNDDLLSEPLHESVDQQQAYRTPRRESFMVESSTESVDMVADGMNLLWGQTLDAPWTTAPDTNSESGMNTTASQGMPHTRIEDQLHSRFSPNFPHKAANPSERACPISSPVKRKASPGKAKVEDTERRPWKIPDPDFEATSWYEP